MQPLEQEALVIGIGVGDAMTQDDDFTASHAVLHQKLDLLMRRKVHHDAYVLHGIERERAGYGSSGMILLFDHCSCCFVSVVVDVGKAQHDIDDSLGTRCRDSRYGVEFAIVASFANTAELFKGRVEGDFPRHDVTSAAMIYTEVEEVVQF